MRTIIGAYDATTRTVAVTFTAGLFVHRRTVNAVLTDAGSYDATATKARVADVARGVAQKMELRLLDNEEVVTAPEVAIGAVGSG